MWAYACLSKHLLNYFRSVRSSELSTECTYVRMCCVQEIRTPFCVSEDKPVHVLFLLFLSRFLRFSPSLLRPIGCFSSNSQISCCRHRQVPNPIPLPPLRLSQVPVQSWEVVPFWPVHLGIQYDIWQSISVFYTVLSKPGSLLNKYSWVVVTQTHEASSSQALQWPGRGYESRKKSMPMFQFLRIFTSQSYFLHALIWPSKLASWLAVNFIFNFFSEIGAESPPPPSWATMENPRASIPHPPVTNSTSSWWKRRRASSSNSSSSSDSPAHPSWAGKSCLNFTSWSWTKRPTTSRPPRPLKTNSVTVRNAR